MTSGQDILRDIKKAMDEIGPLPPDPFRFSLAHAPTFGMPIYESDRLPKIRHPYWYIFPAHPLIVWLSKWLPISPWVWMEANIEVPTAFMIGGRLVMPRSMIVDLGNIVA